jgi:SAM-dependent methyltransferase
MHSPPDQSFDFHTELFKSFQTIPAYSSYASEMATVGQALLEIATVDDMESLVPEARRIAAEVVNAIEEEDALSVEALITVLYSTLHEAGKRYDDFERTSLDRCSGYSCYAGGITPLISALPYIGPQTVVADLGAGNGLQGLLLQKLAPHRLTIQVEISATLIETGKRFTKALALEEKLIEWRRQDISQTALANIDLIYLYRPARPRDGGDAFYRTLAENLDALQPGLIIVSVADCLGPYLSKTFAKLSDNGHLIIFKKIS